MTKPAGKAASRRPITLKLEGSAPEAQARAAVAQKEWAYAIAAGIERGELPDASDERGMIAVIIRRAADGLRVPTVRRRGNPAFERKVPDDDTIPLMVGYRIAFGDELPGAIARVADDCAVDESTVAKLFRARRDAVADWFVNSNLKHRVGAIRGK